MANTLRGRAGWRTLIPFRRSKRRKQEVPIEHVGLFSYLTYSWLDGFMWRGFRSGISEQSLWKCPNVDGAEYNAKRLQAMWEEELKVKGRDGASLLSVFMKFTRKRLLLATFILVLSLALLLLSSAYFLLEILKYSYARHQPLWVGVLLVLGFLLADILQNILFVCVFSITHIAGARLRSGSLLLLYRKLLTVSHLRDKTAGNIVNLFANDSQRIFDGVSYAPMSLVAPLLSIATTAYSVYLLGLWPLVGLAVLACLFPIQMCIGKGIMTFRGRAMPITDDRVRLMSEMLANIKFIKMYSWEKPLTSKVLDIRAGEKSLLEKVNISTSMMFSVSSIIIAMATIATLMAHTLTGYDLSAVQAFTYLALYSSIQGKLMLSTIAVKNLSEMKVAADRFQEILLFEDHTNPVGTEASRRSVIADCVIDVQNTALAWPNMAAPQSENGTGQNGDALKNGKILKSEKDEVNITEIELLNSQNEADDKPSLVLTGLNFRVGQGEVVGVTGPIGAGKTALITSLLGQMQLPRGSIHIVGKLAYAPQQAWLFNASVRDNIVFGRPFNQQRYDEAVRLCCLEADLSILPAGDATEVGERGVTLSGGQKQRISLARALYSDRDIYLLDDPFSAVDPDIADTLFQNIIQNALVGKTVIFVTHTVKYLPECDVILFLRGGTIVQKGSHGKLREEGGEYYSYYLNVKDHEGEGRDLTTDITDVAGEIVDDEINENQTLLARRANKVNAKQIKEEAEKLVQKEEQEMGAVTCATYGVYTRAAGGVLAVLLVVILFTLAEGTRAFSYWWLAHWLSEGSGNTTRTVERVIDNQTVLIGEISRSITDNPKLGFYNLIYGMTLVATLLFFIIRAVVFAKLAMKASNTLHQQLLKKVIHGTMVFFDTTPLGRVMNRFSKDVDELDTQLPSMVEQTLQSIISIIIYVVMISVLLHWFPIVVPPLLVIFLFVYVIFRAGLRDVKRLQNISVSPLLSHISATIQGLYSLHAYEKVPEFTERLIEMLDYNTVTVVVFNCCMRWINLRLSFITSMAACVTALLVILLPDMIQPEYAGLAIVYATQLAGLFQFLTRSAAESEARFTSAERMHNYIQNLDTEGPLVVKSCQPGGSWPNEGHIRFDKYEMRYRPNLPLVLKGVTCEIKPGEKIGIVGRTGSGKSSLASAIFRLVEASGGKVEIDGIDISRIGIEDLRTKLSAIPQDPVLFSGTIRSNLDPSSRSIDEEMWRALEKCHIKDLVLTLEGQLDAVVSEGGENFSAGERQLLCMARVLLRHSRIMVLDEATAAMDSETDALVQTALKEAFADCTLLIIAHRLSTVWTSDRVLVMDQGEIVEFDTPSALRANVDSRFNSLMAVASQQGDNNGNANEMLSSDAWV